VTINEKRTSTFVIKWPASALAEASRGTVEGSIGCIKEADRRKKHFHRCLLNRVHDAHEVCFVRALDADVP
jgi:hypothetical protein